MDKFNAALGAITKEPGMRERLIKQGAQPLGGSAADLSKYLVGEITQWGEVIRVAGNK